MAQVTQLRRRKQIMRILPRDLLEETVDKFREYPSDLSRADLETHALSHWRDIEDAIFDFLGDAKDQTERVS